MDKLADSTWFINSLLLIDEYRFLIIGICQNSEKYFYIRKSFNGP